MSRVRCLKVEHPRGGEIFPLPEAGVVTLGAARDNDLVLAVKGVSRRHARLEIAEGTVRLRDLGSKNRLIIGGERRDEVVLSPGEAVQIGEATVTLEGMARSDAEVALPLDASSTGLSFPSTGKTTSLAGLEVNPSAAEALGFVRRFQGASLDGETRRRFLGEARCLLGVGGILRFLPGDAAEEGFTVIDVVGALPSAAPDAAQPCPDGTRLTWTGRGAEALAPWSQDFLAYVGQRLAEPPPASGTTEAAPIPRTPEELDPPPGMILGDAPATRRLLDEIHAARESPRDVLLLGETGTGKGLVAELIHRSGPRAARPFLAINCAAIPAELLEAELFGVGRGAATNVEARPGLFESARGGTLLLDEIAELPLPLQAKLLRALEEREILPVGTGTSRKVDVKVISACNCDLKRRVEAGRFRADLFYRLDRLRFEIPPLCERREDIPALVAALARRAAREEGLRVRGISRGALTWLETFDWPGNVRQLRAVMERAVLRCRHGDVLRREHFPDLHPAESPVRAETVPAEAAAEEAPPEKALPEKASPRTLQERLDEVERRAIREALLETRGNRAAAARRLGISRQGLHLKIKRLDLDGETG